MKTTSARVVPTLASLEQRIANQERRIATALRTGGLTEQEASSLRERVQTAKTGFEADAFDGNGLTHAQAAQALLDGTSKDLRAAAHDASFDVDKRVAELERRVTAGTTDGTLTEREQKAVGEHLTSLKAKLAQATTPEAKAALRGEVQALGKQIARARHDEQFDAGKRLESFKARIERGVADGTLNAKEAARLHGKVAGLALLDSMGLESGKLFNQVSRGIFHQRHDAQVDVAKRSAAIGSAIDSAAQAGTLTPAQAATFKAQLTALSAPEAEAKGPRLNVLHQQVVSAIAAARAAAAPSVAI